MIRIGIDFSLNSPSVCININNEKLYFISFFNDEGKDWKNSKSEKFQYHNILNNNIVEMIPYTRKINKDDYRLEQKTKMEDAMLLADIIVNRLKEYSNDSDLKIGIEGFSYSSKGSSFIDLIIYNSFLRKKLVDEFGFEKINIISPSEAKKKFSGKGNSNKEKMILSFKENYIKLDLIANSKLFKFVNEIEINYKKIPKPIDDLVDSCGICISI